MFFVILKCIAETKTKSRGVWTGCSALGPHYNLSSSHGIEIREDVQTQRRQTIYFAHS
jgi:hypothetical protein